MMMILLLFVLTYNLDFLLVNAATKNNNERKSKFSPRKHGTDLPLTQGGRIVEEMDYIGENPDMVKSLDMGGLINIVDQFIPGAKALRDPILKTVHHLIPILKVRKSPPNYKHPWSINLTF